MGFLSNILGGKYHAQAGVKKQSKEVADAFDKYYQNYMSAMSGALAGQEVDTANAEAAAAPIRLKSLADLGDQYGMRLYKQDQDIENESRRNEANLNLELLQGAGGQAARAQDQLDRSQNKEYYDILGSIANAARDSLKWTDPGAVSDGELATIRRGLNRSGLDDSAMGAYEAASQFGAAGRQRRYDAERGYNERLDSILGKLPTLFNPRDTFQIATARGAAAPNRGRFDSGFKSAGNQAWDFGQNLQSQYANINNDAERNNRRQGKGLLDYTGQMVNQVSQLAQAAGSVYGGVMGM